MHARTARTLTGAIALLVVLTTGEHPIAQDAPVLRAMADELARSMTQLRLGGEPSPYYIEYEVEERASTRVTARLGALVEDLTGRSRTLRVGVRVGDYSFDSSLFTVPGGAGGVVSLTADGRTSAPLDDDYDSMRRQIWLATDAAYRRAVSVFARKQAAFQNRAGTSDTVPDFSREDPLQTHLGGLPLVFANEGWTERVQQVSAVFSDVPAIESADVSAADTRGTRYYLNSEGFKVVAPIQIASLRVSAEARAHDGSTVRDVFTLVERRLEDLPSESDLLNLARESADRLAAQRAAPMGEEYTGPVLMQGLAAAELVAQTLVPAMQARRPPESAGRGGRGGGGGQVTPYLRRIGLRVLTEPFAVIDTPSLGEFDGRPVAGSYVVDDYGIRARDVTLVENGRLVTLLTGRTPLRGLPRSSGHTRGGDVLASVFQIESAEAMAAEDLRKRYLDLLELQDRSFGYIVRAIAAPGDAPGGGPGTGAMIFDAVKITRQGREEPVRGLRLGGVGPAAFRDLLDASRERTLHSFRGTTSDPVSVIVPDLIFEEIEILEAREVTQKPPLVPSPLTD